MSARRSPDAEFARGLLGSGLRSLAGLGDGLLGAGPGLAVRAAVGLEDADRAAAAGRPVGAPTITGELDALMGTGGSSAYTAGGLLGDVAQLLAPGGLLGRSAGGALQPGGGGHAPSPGLRPPSARIAAAQ